ncbi:phenylalanyl-tRNA synthetase alpha subunit, mitochondrial [Linderina macrospora]|uniref:Phenylalanyl-tRNA synthetase alpha subunit, mitochondrial n=1 Tax=Linderina macrospora TaxID=4868 RepID=A0ACC1JB60_9FUNG|nr:phenylalanyl-tRNA synthetase alpha subunit, mitochondrial [Linderina macrospora]
MLAQIRQKAVSARLLQRCTLNSGRTSLLRATAHAHLQPTRLSFLPIHRASLTTTRTLRDSASQPSELKVLGSTYATDKWTNATSAILDKTGRNLLHQPSHPLAILKELIFKEFPTFAHYDAITPAVSTYNNFDSLGFAKDHIGRSRSDTYYINEKMLLRTHTSAHQLQLLKAGRQGDRSLLDQAKNSKVAPMNERFLVAADVYRRDEIDASHYPVFHQMEGVCTFSRSEIQSSRSAASSPSSSASPVAQLSDTTVINSENPMQPEHTEEEVAFIVEDMKRTMNNMVVQILTKAVAAKKTAGDADNTQTEFPVRWIDAYFPFTSPSWEMEVLFQGEWLEICGCGVIKQKILDDAGMTDRVGWAFGFGLERLAMLLFGVPDIRLFWSSDPRFTNQFAPGQINTFRAFSRHPPCPKDVSFWLPQGGEFHENDLMDLVREVAGDLVEGVKLVDEFTHPKTGKSSRCYRINYCSMDRNVTHEEINEIQDRVRDQMVQRLGITLR